MVDARSFHGVVDGIHEVRKPACDFQPVGPPEVGQCGDQFGGRQTDVRTKTRAALRTTGSKVATPRR